MYLTISLTHAFRDGVGVSEAEEEDEEGGVDDVGGAQGEPRRGRASLSEILSLLLALLV